MSDRTQKLNAECDQQGAIVGRLFTVLVHVHRSQVMISFLSSPPFSLSSLFVPVAVAPNFSTLKFRSFPRGPRRSPTADEKYVPSEKPNVGRNENHRGHKNNAVTRRYGFWTFEYPRNFRENLTHKIRPIIITGWGQLPLRLRAKLNQTVLTWEFPVLNVYLLV